jgi:hypothetical protein
MAENTLPATHTIRVSIRALPPLPTIREEAENLYNEFLTETLGTAEAVVAPAVYQQRVDSHFSPEDVNHTGVFRPFETESSCIVQSKFPIEPLVEIGQPVCRPYLPSVQILFDAANPHASDEDLALQCVFDPPPVWPQYRDPHLNTSEEVCSQTPELLDTEELKLFPTLAVLEVSDPVSKLLEMDLLPSVREPDYGVRPRRPCRSLVRQPNIFKEPAADTPNSAHKSDPKPVTAGDAREACPTGWKLEEDPVLHHVNGSSFLPGLNQLRDMNVRSATIHYDSDLDSLYRATVSFLHDHHDGECSCLDAKWDTLSLPGETLLPTVDDEFGLFVERPTAQSIFDIIDDFVDVHMFDEIDVTDSSSDVSTTIDNLVNVNIFEEKHDSTSDYQDINETTITSALKTDSLSNTNNKVLSQSSASFDPTMQNMLHYNALGQLLYPTVSYDNSHISDTVSDTDDDTTGISELTYFATDTQQNIAYTAFNQLLSMDAENEEEGLRPVIHQDDDTEGYEST